MDVRRLALLAVLAALVFAFWSSWPVYPLKLLVVMLHESGHALATWAVGGSVERVAIDRFQGGLTQSRLPAGALPGLVVASAGYVGSTLFGGVILVAAARSRSGRPVLGALGVLLAGALLLWVRDPFTAVFLACVVAVLLLCARLLPDAASRTLALFLGVFTAAYALWDIRDDLFSGRSGSDADILAAATGIPAIVWAVSWSVMSLLVIRTALLRAAGTRRVSPRRVGSPPARERRRAAPRGRRGPGTRGG